ncbi:MAG: DNA polymerase III subunit gamma/tau [Rhodospirillales bacterium]|nr:DNA polymerase III subunit gamma/tau [Rhodospirillales bacterium]
MNDTVPPVPEEKPAAKPTAVPAAKPAAPDADPYRVLARKYRPASFSGLIGQDVLVRSLTHAFQSGRVAHAFILTGVRGIGKTTTARIIARALNCIGADGQGQPTTEPCGVCTHCTSIAADRHVDVLEMDAASHTGVDDIRELIEGARYRPASARYKVYIIDEVHMLSKNAFNALLKTLEEPPEHVKFVFATTEIRKVPITVLSRCQRFDLNRVDIDVLARHFSGIVDKEKASISDPAMHLIARAADGSVRDGLSLLDQAISQAEGEITEPQVREMLGLADRTQTFELLDWVLAGDIAQALGALDSQYRDGADPVALFEDLLEITHFLTRIKVVPGTENKPGVPEIERTRGAAMAARLTMASLARTWQILLKGLGEVQTAPSPKQAAEMVLVRLAYTANLPTPDEAIRKLVDSPAAVAGSAPAPAASPSAPAGNAPGPSAMAANGGGAAQASAQADPAAVAQPETETVAVAVPVLDSFEDVLALADAKREGVLRTHLVANVRLVHFEPGRIEFSPGPHAPRDLAQSLAAFLKAHSDRRWMVSVSSEQGDATISEQRATAVENLKAEAAAEPLVRAVLEMFPGATIDTVVREALPDPVAIADADDDDSDRIDEFD